MSVYSDIYTVISTASGLSVYRGRVKQSESGNYIVFNTVSKVPTPSKDAETEADEYRVQIDIVCSDIDTATTKSQNIRTALDGYTGGSIKYAYYVDSTELNYDDDVDVYVISDDYIIEENK
jgi:hypothetical protein